MITLHHKIIKRTLKRAVRAMNQIFVKKAFQSRKCLYLQHIQRSLKRKQIVLHIKLNKPPKKKFRKPRKKARFSRKKSRRNMSLANANIVRQLSSTVNTKLDCAEDAT